MGKAKAFHEKRGGRIVMGISLETLKTPALAALFALFGLALFKRPLAGVLSGTMKTLIGYMLIVFATRIATEAVGPIVEWARGGFGSDAVILNSEFMGAILLGRYGFEGFCVMFIAIAVNILMARYTKLNGSYLTGHHLLYSSLLASAILGGTRLEPWAAALLGGVIVGLYASVSVKATRPFLEKVTGSAGIGFANSGNTAIVLGSLIGKLCSGKRRFDKGRKARFEIKDVAVLSTAAMFFYNLFFGFAANAPFEQIAQECVASALCFGAATYAVFLGMRMLLAEVIQLIYALHGKFAPKAVKGVDASAVISYAPAAWIFGFVICFAAGVAFMLVSIVSKAKFIVLPGVASSFFAGGACAVFANAYGGKRGAAVACAVLGIVIPLGAIFLQSSSPYAPAAGFAFGETEYGVWGGLLAWVTGRLA